MFAHAWVPLGVQSKGGIPVPLIPQFPFIYQVFHDWKTS